MGSRPLGSARQRFAMLLATLALVSLGGPRRVPAAAGPGFPPLTGRVVDDAGVLSSATRDDLTASLARHEQATGEQVVVVTLASLQGFTIEDFGYQLGRAWGIGEKGKNTGALLIIAPKDRRVRIEVGYGLEGKLTDAQSRVIIERDILPAFRRRDFDAGVTAGAAAILTALGGDLPSAPDAGNGVAWHSPPSLGALGWVILLFAIYGLPLMLSMLRTNRYRAGPGGVMWRSADPWPSSGGFGYAPGPFFRGGLGSGGGGFSGDGGSFGGGGASGGW